jgi:hypothetical protein
VLDASGNHPEPRSLPDTSICCAAHGAIGGLIYCLVSCPDNCQYARFLADDIFCCHPLGMDIVARTVAKQRKGLAS